MQLETVRTMFDYHIWANRQVWDCIESITYELFTQEHDHSIGSLHNQAYHLMHTDWSTALWFAGLMPKEGDPDYITQEEFPDRASIRQKWDEAEAKFSAFLESLTDEKLNETMQMPKSKEETFDTNLGEMLMATFNHGTNHRAQIMALINKFGGKTVEQGLYFYLMGR
ncbi:MAG: hypothetical protein GY943_21175 [Chloroflexi bacterium]|nr:hypothetical protein [Chloroflexota bacterium]